MLQFIIVRISTDSKQSKVYIHAHVYGSLGKEKMYVKVLLFINQKQAKGLGP